MRFFRLLVFVLLVDQHCAWFALHPVWNKRDASRLKTRSLSEGLQNLGNLSPIFLGKPHPDSEADHGKHFLKPR
jgi:hypothetical protein